MKRSKSLPRRPLRPSAPPLGRKRKPLKGRSAAEFDRIYGSRARVRFVKSLPCWACMTSDDPWGYYGQPSDNAHTVSGGKGRKADYDTIIPLCRGHHERYDQYKPPFQRDSMKREAAKAHATAVERLWQQQNPEHISGPLGRVLENLLTDEGDVA